MRLRIKVSGADESISIDTPLIRIRAVGVGVKVAQLVQFSLPIAEVVGIGDDGGDAVGIAKGTISGRT